METELLERAKELLERGKRHSAAIKRSDRFGANYWYSDEQIPEIRSWFDSVFNLFRLVTTPDMHFHEQVVEISKNDDLKRGAPYWAVQNLCGNLASLIEELELTCFIHHTTNM
jgi:hypothetical protein